MKHAILTLVLTISTMLLIHSCKAKDAIKQKSQDEINSRMADIFENKKYMCTLNESKDLRLCIADDDPQGDRLRKVYGVLNSSYDIVYGLKKVHGQVYWSDDNHIMIETYPRVVDRNTKDDQIRKQKINIR